MFTLHCLKQGTTGVVKTWSLAPILLDYLFLRGGLCRTGEKVFPSTNSVLNLLDLTLLYCTFSASSLSYCILEVRGGTGFLSLGLAMSLNTKLRGVQLVCTNGDKSTLKNLQHNIKQQAVETHVTKTMQVSLLE
uniref:Uncharacterized protein n=1 Tax=Corethron hystrix TaxID=216773 RepID=A0A7S1BK97_9STRA